MKLYFSKGACSLAVRIAIHEIGIPCEFESVSLKTKKTASGADFLAINPKGAVPALLLDDKNVITENAAIQQYLADTYKATQLLPPIGEFNRYRVLEWLNFVSTDLHKGASPLFNPNLIEEAKEAIFKTNLKKSLQFVDDHLSQHKYLLNDEQFTLADGYLFVVLTWMPYLGIELKNYTHVQRYFDALKGRNSIRQAMTEEGF